MNCVCHFINLSIRSIAKALAMCTRDMGNGCTMGQMFNGDPEQCGGKMVYRSGKIIYTGQPAQPYSTIWGKSFASLNSMRSIEYKKGTNEGILQAGVEPLKYAKKKAETQGAKFGIGVCTTMAAAGQTAIAQLMEEDLATWKGTEIMFVREAYPGMDDGHEYLMISHPSSHDRVLVDYWYAAMHGDPEANIGMKSDLVVDGGPWDVDNMATAQDEGKDRIYIVGGPKAAVMSCCKSVSNKKSLCRQNGKAGSIEPPGKVMYLVFACDFFVGVSFWYFFGTSWRCLIKQDNLIL